MKLSRLILLTGFLLQATAFCVLQPAAASKGAPDTVGSYYPHWVARDGTLSDQIIGTLAPGTIIGVHHRWPIEEVSRVLDAPGHFQIAWYVEANVEELNDPALPGTPVAERIAEARLKQDALAAAYGADRFSNLIELDGARDKYEGSLHGMGNAAEDWVQDAAAAKAAGFRYIAKSPTKAHVRALRGMFGSDFVPRIVFEDITGSGADENPGYRSDAKALADDKAMMTLIVHEGAYGEFPATSLESAQEIVGTDFPGGRIEAYWGRATSEDAVVKLKDFDTPAVTPASATASK